MINVDQTMAGYEVKQYYSNRFTGHWLFPLSRTVRPYGDTEYLYGVVQNFGDRLGDGSSKWPTMAQALRHQRCY